MVPRASALGLVYVFPFLEDYEKLSTEDNFVKNYHNYHNYHTYTETPKDGGFSVSGFKQQN